MSAVWKRENEFLKTILYRSEKCWEIACHGLERVIAGNGHRLVIKATAICICHNPTCLKQSLLFVFNLMIKERNQLWHSATEGHKNQLVLQDWTPRWPSKQEEAFRHTRGKVTAAVRAVSCPAVSELWLCASHAPTSSHLSSLAEHSPCCRERESGGLRSGCKHSLRSCHNSYYFMWMSAPPLFILRTTRSNCCQVHPTSFSQSELFP